MANRRSSRCDRRRRIETREAAPSLRQTALRCGVRARPSGGIFCCRPSSTAAAAHGCRLARKRPLTERSPEAASLLPGSNPGSQYRQTFRTADLCQIGAQATGLIPCRNQPQHPPHFRSPGRLSTRPTVPPVSSYPQSLDTPSDKNVRAPNEATSPSATAVQEDLQWVLSGLVPWALPCSSGTAKHRFVRRNRLTLTNSPKGSQFR
jgi:hypothetical protein